MNNRPSFPPLFTLSEGKHVEHKVEIAPKSCIVCGKAHPGGKNLPDWSYLAGATPIGAITCSVDCLRTAIDRFQKTGRCDALG